MASANCLLYECFSGISGDMHLGALIDLGVPAEFLTQNLRKLGLDDEFRLHVSRTSKHGIEGTDVTVECLEASGAARRTLPDINDIIDQAGLPSDTAGLAKSMFHALASAEAKVHGVGVEEVHLHETGATDALVDLVGAALGIGYLAPDTICSGPVELGSGTVECDHGTMPVPAPATAELLKGVPVMRGGVEGEATTPTGAAILATVVDQWNSKVSFSAERIGYGMGKRDFRLPNVLRLAFGSTDQALESERICEIETNLDDMSPEAFEPLLEDLLQAGAQDVFFTPIVMKKSRPGVRVSVLAKDDDRLRIASQLIASSTTLGVRIHSLDKLLLSRTSDTVPTELGLVRVKTVNLPSGGARWKAEFEDVKRIAREHGMTYQRAKILIDAELAFKLA